MVTEVLNESEELLFCNDGSRGNFARQIVGFVADGSNWILLYSGTPCPGYKFNFSLRYSILSKSMEIQELSFNNFGKHEHRSIAEKANAIMKGT